MCTGVSNNSHLLAKASVLYHGFQSMQVTVRIFLILRYYGLAQYILLEQNKDSVPVLKCFERGIIITGTLSASSKVWVSSSYVSMGEDLCISFPLHCNPHPTPLLSWHLHFQPPFQQTRSQAWPCFWHALLLPYETPHLSEHLEVPCRCSGNYKSRSLNRKQLCLWTTVDSVFYCNKGQELVCG